MRLLVTGDRAWRDSDYIDTVLDDIARFYDIEVLIEGCAPGVDERAGAHPGMVRQKLVVPAGWAYRRGYPGEHYPADWKLGRQAGFLRNETMLRMSRPDIVVAFHPSLGNAKGTKHMVEIARAAKVPTYVFPNSHFDIEDIAADVRG